MPWNKKQIKSAVEQVEQNLMIHPEGKRLALHVRPNGFQVNDKWLLVIVEPGVENVNGLEYVWALNDVEKELQQDGLADVTLVPAIVR